MSSASVAASEKIVLNFAWAGPNRRRSGSSRSDLDVRVVDLVFNGLKADVSVDLPENINPIEPQTFPFTCRKYHETEMEVRVTRPDSLSVIPERVHNLTITARFFKKGSPSGPNSSGSTTQQETVVRSDRQVWLEIPEKLEPGQTYNLVVSSADDLWLSARLVKATVASPSTEDEKKASTNVSDLDKLSVSELQSCLNATFKKDKEFENQCMSTAMTGNMPEMERIFNDQIANGQLRKNLVKALQRKGIEPKMPQSASFRFATSGADALNGNNCKMQ